ncbi:MAG TPA: hypothetical protein VNV86_08960 [Candidatus Acidoferrum sp.]|nr:hypothetical protein [Candidatus Acidoferrum sp.]
MKTLHLANSWHPESGGIATFYRELLRQAERERRPIRLVVPDAEDGVEDLGDYGRIWGLMRRGLLVTGNDGESLRSDLRRIPAALAGMFRGVSQDV